MSEFPIYCLFLNDAGLAKYREGWGWKNNNLFAINFNTHAFQFTL